MCTCVLPAYISCAQSSRKVLALLELELQVVVRHHGVLGFKLRSSAETASALNH